MANNDDAGSAGQGVPPQDNSPYPDFDMNKILQYSNRQIEHYIRNGAFSPSQLATFTKAVENRRKVLDALKCSGESDHETEDDVVSDFVREVPAQPAARVVYDSDSDFPQYDPHKKGVKLDNTITQLKVDGGLANFNLWLGDLRNAFAGDPNRFTAAGQRILLAGANMEGTLRSLHAVSANQDPRLRQHWRRFLRWVKENSLHGEADRTATLIKWNEAKQAANESPSHFYNRLAILAAELDRVVDQDELLPRLQKGPQNALIRGDRKGRNAQELLHNAQEIWGTFDHRDAKRRREDDNDSPPDRPPQRKNMRDRARTAEPKRRGWARSARPDPKPGKISTEERERRQKDSACFNCGKPNHMASECRGKFNPDPPTKPSGAPPKPSPTTRVNEARRGWRNSPRPLARQSRTPSSISRRSTLDTDTEGKPILEELSEN